MSSKVLFNPLNYKFEEVCDLNIRQINAAFRAVDESHLWPVSGRFNATERAIRRLRKFRQATGEADGGYEYVLSLEKEITKIVNNC